MGSRRLTSVINAADAKPRAAWSSSRPALTAADVPGPWMESRWCAGRGVGDARTAAAFVKGAAGALDRAICVRNATDAKIDARGACPPIAHGPLHNFVLFSKTKFPPVAVPSMPAPGVATQSPPVYYNDALEVIAHQPEPQMLPTYQVVRNAPEPRVEKSPNPVDHLEDTEEPLAETLERRKSREEAIFDSVFLSARSVCRGLEGSRRSP